MGEPAQYIPNPNVVSTELDDAESVLLDLNTRRYYTLNETGVVIWQQLKDGKSIREVAVAVASRFDITADEATTFVEVFVSSLEQEGLVSRA